MIDPIKGFDYHGGLGLHTLFAPSDPLIEFVFIHGLGGGSTKTWCLKPDPAYFWPKEWLPHHPGFRNVRIHSFGYDSDWKAKGHSATTTRDFGQAFLLALRSSECFSIVGTKPPAEITSMLVPGVLTFPGVQNPIVLVAHSMGGIIAKEASLLRLLLPPLRTLQRGSNKDTPWARPTLWHNKILPAVN